MQLVVFSPRNHRALRTWLTSQDGMNERALARKVYLGAVLHPQGGPATALTLVRANDGQNELFFATTGDEHAFAYGNLDIENVFDGLSSFTAFHQPDLDFGSDYFEDLNVSFSIEEDLEAGIGQPRIAITLSGLSLSNHYDPIEAYKWAHWDGILEGLIATPSG